MFNEFTNWLGKKAHQVGNDIHNDIVKPVQHEVHSGENALHSAIHAITPDVQHPVQHLAQPAFHAASNFLSDATKPLNPGFHAAKSVFTNDAVKPAENVFHAVKSPVDTGLHDAFHAIGATVHAAPNYLEAPPKAVFHEATALPKQFEAKVATPIDKLADKSSVGRVAEGVGLGALRGGVGLAQGVSGLADLASPGKGTSRVSKGLNSFAKTIDTTAKQSGDGKGAYIAGQVAANILPFAVGAGEVADATKGASLFDKADQAVEAATKGLSERGAVGRIAAKTIQEAASPKNALVNGAWQGLNAGQQASKGRKVSPLSELENFGAFQAGVPLAGSVAKEGFVAAKPYLEAPAKAAVKSASERLEDAMEAFHANNAKLAASQGGYYKLPNGGHVLESNDKGIKLNPDTGEYEPIKDVNKSPEGEVTSGVSASSAGTNDVQSSTETPGTPHKTEPDQNNKQSSSASRAFSENVQAGRSHTSKQELPPQESVPHNSNNEQVEKQIPPKDQAQAQQRQPQNKLSENLSLDQEKRPSDADNTTPKPISPVSGRTVHPEALDKFKDDGAYTEHPNGDISYKGKTYTAKQWQQLKDDSVNTPYGQEASASEIKEMDDKNPVKVNVEKTEAGDYAHARAVAQQASVPTRIATYLAARAAKQADLSTRDLADMVEHPEDHTDLTPKQAKAVERYKALTNRINATSHAVGGTEKQLDNYFNHHIDTSTWKKTEDGMLIDPNTGKIYDPEDFRGVNATHRLTDENGKMVFPDVRSLNKAGYHLVDEDKNASKAINEYGGKAASKLEKQALKKAFTEADAGQKDQTHPIDLDDHSDAPLMLSKTGQNEIKGYLNAHGGKLLDAVDKVGSPIKHVLLSASQYHPININLLTAAPSLIMRGHPLMAARGLADTVGTAFSKEYSDRLLEEDLKSGLVEKAAKIGMPYGRSDFTTSGIASKMGETVFGRQIPAMYRQVAKATVDQLEKNDISLDSQTARDLGQVGNTTMGFVNRQAQNLSPGLQRILSNFFLAPQFEESKLMILKDAFVPNSVSAKLGMEGASAIARRAAFATVFGKYAAEAATAVGLGLLFHQKVNSIGDTLKEVAINPYVPTPFHNSSGANIKLKMPDSGASEIANIIGGVTRGKDGRLHLGISSPSTDFTNLKQDIVDKASPLASAIAALATNKNYEGNPLSDPDLPATTQAQQKAASLITNFLPIGLQGLAYNKTIDQHLPTAVRQVLEASSPGTSPLLKSGLSTVALTPETDELSGKGLTDTQYYNALDKWGSTLLPNSPAYGAFLENFGSTKDPVTGKYTEVPNSEMTVAKSASLNAYPAAAKAANSMMKQLAKEGQKVDPYYLLTPTQQKAYNAYETMAPLSADRTNWENNNKWYNAFATKEQNYFNSLPPGNPDKPTNPIKYPTFSKSVTNQLNTYYALTNSTAKDTYLDNHPAVISAMNAQFKYDNAVRVARGYAPVKGYPTESPALQSQLKIYDSLSKSDQDAYAAAHPDIYNFFELASQYDLIKDAGQNQFVGNNITPAEVKTINSLGDDIYYSGGLIGDNGQIVAPTGSSGSSSDYDDDEYSSTGYYSPAAIAARGLEYGKLPKVKIDKYAAPVTKVKPVLTMPMPYLSAPPKISKPTLRVSVNRGRDLHIV